MFQGCQPLAAGQCIGIAAGHHPFPGLQIRYRLDAHTAGKNHDRLDFFDGCGTGNQHSFQIFRITDVIRCDLSGHFPCVGQVFLQSVIRFLRKMDLPAAVADQQECFLRQKRIQDSSVLQFCDQPLKPSPLLPFFPG